MFTKKKKKYIYIYFFQWHEIYDEIIRVHCNMACILGIIIVPIIHKRITIAETILAHRYWGKNSGIDGTMWMGLRDGKFVRKKEYCLKN